MPAYCFPATSQQPSDSRRLAVESITESRRLKRDECPSCNGLVFPTPAKPLWCPLGSPTARRASEEKQHVSCTSAIVPPTAAWNTVVSAVQRKRTNVRVVNSILAISVCTSPTISAATVNGQFGLSDQGFFDYFSFGDALAVLQPGFISAFGWCLEREGVGTPCYIPSVSNTELRWT